MSSGFLLLAAAESYKGELDDVLTRLKAAIDRAIEKLN